MRYENVAGRSKRNAPRDKWLADVAGRQHGVVTVAQLAHVGLTTAGISHRVGAGRLHRVHRGVYAVGHARLSREGHWMAAVLAAGEGAALAGLSAAVHWQIWRRRVDVIEVVTLRQHRPQRGFRMRWCRGPDPHDLTVRNGIPVTTVARTQVDLTDTLTSYQLANVIHEAALRKRFNLRATRAAMQRAHGRHRLHVLVSALALNASGSAGTRVSTKISSWISCISPASRSRP